MKMYDPEQPCNDCEHIIYCWGFEYWCEIGKPKCRKHS